VYRDFLGALEVDPAGPHQVALQEEQLEPGRARVVSGLVGANEGGQWAQFENNYFTAM